MIMQVFYDFFCKKSAVQDFFMAVEVEPDIQDVLQ